MKVLLSSATLFFIASIIAVVTVYAQTSTPCHTIISNTDSVSSRYAVPWNLFSSTQNPIMTVHCNTYGSPEVVVSDDDSTLYIYKYGYQKVDGSWEKITFSGRNQTSAWIVGEASAQVDEVEAGEVGKVLAYICQKVDGSWKCGCHDEACAKPKWSIQEYNSGDTPTQEEPSQEKIENMLEDFSLGEKGALDVHYPSKYVGLPGEEIRLKGSGFTNTPTNNILWNGKVEEEGVTAKGSGQMMITVPDLPPGKYDVEVEDEDGNVSAYGTVIWVGTGSEEVPEVDRILPQIIDQGETITIHGSGFTKENNDLITTFGVMSGNPSPDGTTITLEYNPFDEDLKSYNRDGERIDYKMPIYVTVINTSGVSNTEMFELTL